jgi:hypothetical protein
MGRQILSPKEKGFTFRFAEGKSLLPSSKVLLGLWPSKSWPL